MKKCLTIAISTIALSMPQFAAANSVSASYVKMKIEGQSYDGFKLGGSLKFMDDFGLDLTNFAMRHNQSENLTVDETFIRLKYAKQLNKTLGATFALGNRDFSVGGSNSFLKESSLEYGLGIQAAINDKLSLDFALLDYSNDIFKLTKELTVNYMVTNNISIDFNTSNESNIDKTSLGMRYKF